MSFKKVGHWWADSDIDIVKIDGQKYALNGWNGERFLDCWDVLTPIMSLTDNRYTITPIYNDNEGDPKIIDYEVVKN